MQRGQDSLVLLPLPAFGLICVHPRRAGQLLIVMLPLAAFERQLDPDSWLLCTYILREKKLGLTNALRKQYSSVANRNWGN